MTETDIQNKIIEIERHCQEQGDIDELAYQQAVLMGETLQAIAMGKQPAQKLAESALGVLSIRLGQSRTFMANVLRKKEGEK